MATGGDGQLTNNQIVRLAAAISSRDMESIALGYLGIEEETIKNFKDARRDNLEAFNRDIIQHWVYKNPEEDQVGVRKNSLLFSKFRPFNTIGCENSSFYLLNSCMVRIHEFLSSLTRRPTPRESPTYYLVIFFPGNA